MESRQKWLTIVKNELSKSPLVSNAAFGFILMGLEKLVELEFECPCNPTENRIFSSAFFIIPAIIAITVMLIIQGCRCDKGCWKRISISSLVPAIVWLILLFLDGQYFACAMTDWEGRFVLVDKAAPHKWCEPISKDNVTLQERMLRSQRLFFISQSIGIALLILIWVVLIVYGNPIVNVIIKSCIQKKDMQAENAAELTGLRTSSLPGHHERENTAHPTSPADIDTL